MPTLPLKKKKTRKVRKMLNSVTLMGRLTRDPELRMTQSGTPVAAFTLAVDRDFKGQDGQRETDFIDFVAWRNTAEFVSRYFSKGRMAVVNGRIQTRTWQDKDGKNRKAVEVVAENVYFGDSKKDGDSGGYPAARQNSSAGGAGYAANTEFTELDVDDGELPF